MSKQLVIKNQEDWYVKIFDFSMIILKDIKKGVIFLAKFTALV